MTPRKPPSELTLAWALIGIVTIGRLLYAQAFHLSPDETNYWQWSRYLAWAYHDQTPMIAWTIRLFTSILGHTELAVRLPSILSMAVGSAYLVKMAGRWFSARIALHTALITQAVLIFNIGAILATADGLQGAAWAAASYHVAAGFEDHRWRQWLLGGMWFGFGMLCKYTMVVFLPIVFLFGLLTPECRPRLWTIRPYVGLVVGLVMFSPVVAWNAQNDWNSFRHVAYLGGANEGVSLQFKFLGEYLGSQLGLLTPLVFGLVCASWIRSIRRWRSGDHWIRRFLLMTSFAVVAGFGILSLHTRVYGNWACFGYLTGAVLMAADWATGKAPEDHASHLPTRSIWRWTLGSAVAFTLLVFSHVLWPFLPIPADADRTISEIGGWKQLGEAVGRAHADMPQPQRTFIFGLKYQTASELAFYVPGQPKTVSINRWHRPNVYDYWWQDSDLAGKDAVGILRDAGWRAHLLEVFQRVDAPIQVPVSAVAAKVGLPRGRAPQKVYFLYKCYGFKGGLRWVPPPDRRDVRAPRKSSS